jgi:hypothetical protein
MKKQWELHEMCRTDILSFHTTADGVLIVSSSVGDPLAHMQKMKEIYERYNNANDEDAKSGYCVLTFTKDNWKDRWLERKNVRYSHPLKNKWRISTKKGYKKTIISRFPILKEFMRHTDQFISHLNKITSI